MNPIVQAVTDRIRRRSAEPRCRYLERIDAAAASGPRRELFATLRANVSGAEAGASFPGGA